MSDANTKQSVAQTPHKYSGYADGSACYVCGLTKQNTQMHPQQSVERCKYRHDWIRTAVIEHHSKDCDFRLNRGTCNCHEPETPEILCSQCRVRPTAKQMKEAEAIVHLRSMLKPGDTVYTVLRHVSRSGMTRGIDCYVIADNRPVWITGYVGHAIGSPQPHPA